MAYQSESSARGILLDFDYHLYFAAMDNETAGKIIKNIFAAVNGDQLQEMPKEVAPIQSFMLTKVNENIRRYQEKCERNARNAQQAAVKDGLQSQAVGSSSTKSQNPDSNIIKGNKEKSKEINNTLKKSNTIFKPPTVAEVKAYCEERNNGIDAQRFVDYYTSNGWRVGKSPMKDWKAAVRTWEQSTKSPNADTRQRKYSQDIFDRIINERGVST